MPHAWCPGFSSESYTLYWTLNIPFISYAYYTTVLTGAATMSLVMAGDRVVTHARLRTCQEIRYQHTGRTQQQRSTSKKGGTYMEVWRCLFFPTKTNAGGRNRKRRRGGFFVWVGLGWGNLMDEMVLPVLRHEAARSTVINYPKNPCTRHASQTQGSGPEPSPFSMGSGPGIWFG